jgi:hypothetical protein
VRSRPNRTTSESTPTAEVCPVDHGVGYEGTHGLGCDHQPPECPYCHRVMTNREAAEQGACNDCYQAR